MKQIFQKRKDTESKGVVYIIDESSLINMLINLAEIKEKSLYGKVDHIAIINSKMSAFNFQQYFDIVYEVNNTVDHFDVFKKYVTIAGQSQILYIFNNVYKLPKDILIEDNKNIAVDSYVSLDNLTAKTLHEIIKYYLPIKNTYFKIKIYREASTGRTTLVAKLEDIHAFDELILLSPKKIHSMLNGESIELKNDRYKEIYSKYAKDLTSLRITEEKFIPKITYVSRSMISTYGIMKTEIPFSKINETIKKRVDKDNCVGEKHGCGCPCMNNDNDE